MLICSGGEFKGPSGTIESTNYPEQYPESQRCYYRIRVAEGSVVELTFQTFETERHFDSVTVCIIIYDYVCVLVAYMFKIQLLSIK